MSDILLLHSFYLAFKFRAKSKHIIFSKLAALSSWTLTNFIVWNLNCSLTWLYLFLLSPLMSGPKNCIIWELNMKKVRGVLMYLCYVPGFVRCVSESWRNGATHYCRKFASTWPWLTVWPRVLVNLTVDRRGLVPLFFNRLAVSPFLSNVQDNDSPRVLKLSTRTGRLATPSRRLFFHRCITNVGWIRAHVSSINKV